MPAPHAASNAPLATATTPAVEIWIKPVGARRQAFYRSVGAMAWRGMQMLHAERALRSGSLTINGSVFPAVVSRETLAGTVA